MFQTDAKAISLEISVTGYIQTFYSSNTQDLRMNIEISLINSGNEIKSTGEEWL